MSERFKEAPLQVTAAMERAPGDGSRLEAVFLEHQTRVFRAAYRITGNAHDAEDVLQTVFLRLARREEGELPADNLASYLYRSAINAALDLLRSRRTQDGVPLEQVEASLESKVTRPDRAHESSEIRERLRRAMSRLGPRAAEVFALRYLEGYDNKEIAAMLGTSRVTVAVTLHRTRHRLQKDFRGMREKV